MSNMAHVECPIKRETNVKPELDVKNPKWVFQFRVQHTAFRIFPHAQNTWPPASHPHTSSVSPPRVSLTGWGWDAPACKCLDSNHTKRKTTSDRKSMRTNPIWDVDLHTRHEAFFISDAKHPMWNFGFHFQHVAPCISDHTENQCSSEHRCEKSNVGLLLSRSAWRISNFPSCGITWPPRPTRTPRVGDLKEFH